MLNRISLLSILILPSTRTRVFHAVSFLQVSPLKPCTRGSPSSPPHPPSFDHRNNTGSGRQIVKFRIMQFCSAACYFLPLTKIRSLHANRVRYRVHNSPRHLPILSHMKPVNVHTPTPFTAIRHMSQLSSHLRRCSMWPFTFRFLHQNPVITLLPHMYHMSHKSYAP
jgi:hypothetical protein